MIEAILYVGIATGFMDAGFGFWKALWWPIEVGKLAGRAVLTAERKGEDE